MSFVIASQCKPARAGDALSEAIQTCFDNKEDWIASSQPFLETEEQLLLAMTAYSNAS